MKTEKAETKKNRQISRLEKIAAKPQIGGLFVFLMVLLVIVYIVDEVTSNMTSTMQPYAIYDLFKIPGADARTEEYTSAVSLMTLISMPAYAFALLLPFYKSLADKIGRKPMMIINTFGMALGMFLCMVSTHYIVFILGTLIIQFMQPNDIQVIFIMETAPAKHRAKLCSIAKSIALVSVSLIGVLRSIFYNPEELTSWRMVYLVPVILAVAAALICIPLVKETPVFVRKRLDYLNGVAVEEKEEKPEEKKKGGFVTAVKYIFHSKQLRSIALVGFIFFLSTSITSYYTTILEAAGSAGTITNSQIDKIIIFYPFINGLVTFFSGFFSDSLGRKKSSIVLGAIASAGLFMFVLGSRYGWNEYIIGGGYGMFIGGLWSVSDILLIMLPAESCPTEIRSSVIGVMSLVAALGAVATPLMAFLMDAVGTEIIGLVFLCISLPFMLAAIVILSVKVKETKGVDLDSIQ